MANNVKNAVVKKMIEGALCDLMIKTSTENVVDSAGKTLASTLSDIIADMANLPTTDTVDARIKAIVGAAPEALDTLVEIAKALNNDPNFSATITNLLANKVDKVSGKQLSTNDFTNALKTKLEGLSNYVHPATHSADMIADSSTKVMMTPAERKKLEGLSNYVHPSTHSIDMITESTTKKIMTAAERTKIAASGRILSGTTTPADLTDKDLFLQIVE